MQVRVMRLQLLAGFFNVFANGSELRLRFSTGPAFECPATEHQHTRLHVPEVHLDHRVRVVGFAQFALEDLCEKFTCLVGHAL